MSGTTIASVQPARQQDLARRGRWCVVAGLVGLAQGAAVLVWPRQVGEGRYSFPFSASWHVVAQATFFLQHLPLVAAVAAVAAVPAIRQERLAHRALIVATIGLGLLALLELVAMTAATTASDSSLAIAVNTAYGVPVLLTGAGLMVASIVLLRRHILGHRLPLTLLALGLFVFAVLTPALSTDSFLAGRLAIMGWMALFTLLGHVMQRPGR